MLNAPKPDRGQDWDGHQGLEEDAVIRNFLITAADGKTYDTKHYNLSAIIAVGYKVNSERAVQFRKWATRVIQEFTIKGFAMDDERLRPNRRKIAPLGGKQVRVFV